MRRQWMGRAAVLVATTLVGGLGAALGGAGAAEAAPAHVTDPAALVNPFVGTANGGDTFPGADTPFGMVQWSPDTTPSRPDGGGYDYNSSSITGFSLTHLSGPGCPAEGDVPILPTTGAIGSDPAAQTAGFSHSSETANPGYYAVTAGGVRTQLTATTRSGMARFTFPSSSSTGNLLFKLAASETPDTATHFTAVSNREIAGWVRTGAFCGAKNHYTLYFDMVFDHPFVSTGSWTSGGRGAYVSFDTSHTPVVLAKVGISYMSDANAALNRATENPRWDFPAVRRAAHRDWNRMLGRIQVGGGTTTDRTNFYTALYHSLLHPNVFSDVNGQYMGYDGQVHTLAPGQHAEYANYSGWDIYRSEIPLEAMLAPTQTSDIVTSMLNDYAQTGQFPKWSENNGESYVMVGDPADGIIADAYAYGARHFDTAQALRDMQTEATVPNRIRPGLATLRKKGYLPINGTYGCCNFYGPVSTQEEYDIADNAISQFAQELHRGAVAHRYAIRAQNWQNVFNPGTGFVEPKETTGQFEPGFNPTSSNGFVEADAYVYTAFVPWDLKGLIAAEGGNASYTAYLDQMTANVHSQGATRVQMGNEPSFNIPWEYDWSGAPYKTQQVIREIQTQDYADTPGGLMGNDDLGAMSSWYVFSALGMYPEIPGSANTAVGSPLFTSVRIHLGNGRTITESAPAAADNAPYVHNLTVNRASWEKAYLPASLVRDGGRVDWTLATTPDTTWAAAPGDAPQSDTAGLLPALGYLGGSNAGDVVVAPGASTTLHLGVQDLRPGAQHITWRAAAPKGSGLVIGPTNGTVTVRRDGHATEPVQVQVPSSTPDGQYLVRFAMRSSLGTRLPDVVAQISVARPGDLSPYFNDTGISSDSNQGAANFDGDGFSYSQQQMTAAGLAPGATVTSGGVRYTMPDVSAGSPDNVTTGGQDIAVPPDSGATQLGVLGSASNGPSTGTMTITYTDGTTQTATLGFSDWTLNAGSSSPLSGTTTVAKMPYRNTVGGSSQTIATYVFTTTVPLQAGKTVASVTLPSQVAQGELHVFALGTDKGPLTTAS